MRNSTNLATRIRLAELRNTGSLDKVKEKCDEQRKKQKEKQKRYRRYPDAPRRPYNFSKITDV